MPAPAAPLVELLLTGELEILGRMPWSSNGTFLVEATRDGACVRAVYKPLRGERPLWDFPGGLYRREVAAYELAEALGWDLVPLTVKRVEAPFDEGSLQAFVEADFEQHYFTLLEDESLHPQFKRMCVFDLLANNTDRKSGHCLIDADRHIWGIDNGLSFHAEPKLRTVIWDFAGEAIPEDLLGDVQRFVDQPISGPLRELLDPFERASLEARARGVLAARVFPTDTTGHAHPWPLV